MVRHLTTLILGGILGSMVLTGNAEACWKRNCGHKAPVACAAPVICAAPVVCPAPPTPCVRQVACKPTCAPKVKCCKITLPKLCLPKFCHKKTCAPVVVACATPAPIVYGYPAASPQASFQH
jgi:hypothetical protein